MRYFTITTLGCKVNQYDATVVTEALRQANWSPAQPNQPPDLVMINTCCVTASAMRKSRYAIRRIVRQAPGAAVFVLGCYGAVGKSRLHRLLQTLEVPSHRILIAGNQDDLAACIRTLAGNSSLMNQTIQGEKGFNFFQKQKRDFSASPDGMTELAQVKTDRKRRLGQGCPGTEILGSLQTFPDHQRAFVKVQDGCDAFCNYCIVPYTRPRVWSRREEEILAECQQLIAAGHKEIVLCGVFLGAFNRPTAVRRKWSDSPDALPGLVKRVSELPGLWRVRLSSLEPGDLTDELLAVLRDSPTAAPHLHLPLQSGSDRILKRMNRQYRSGAYRDAIARLRDALDRPAVSTDVIVGYPGETEEDFAQTLAVAREAGFSKMHIFPFSPQEPTAAWLRRAEAPPQGIVRKRLEQLAELEADLARAYRKQFVGEVMEGVVEKDDSAERATLDEAHLWHLGNPAPSDTRIAMTSRYLAVEFPTPPTNDLTGKIVKLRIAGVTKAGLAGELESIQPISSL